MFHYGRSDLSENSIAAKWALYLRCHGKLVCSKFRPTIDTLVEQSSGTLPRGGSPCRDCLSRYFFRTRFHDSGHSRGFKPELNISKQSDQAEALKASRPALSSRKAPLPYLGSFE